MEKIGNILEKAIQNDTFISPAFCKGYKEYLRKKELEAMENKSISFKIQGKPIAKQSVKFTHSGIKYTPKHITEYSNWVKLSFKQKYQDFTPFETPLKVELNVAFEIPKSFSKKKQEKALNGSLKPVVKPDCDNISKNILDSLNGIAYVDDKQIVELKVCKFYDESPFVNVELIEMTE